jgi:hypothetical protein
MRFALATLCVTAVALLAWPNHLLAQRDPLLVEGATVRIETAAGRIQGRLIRLAGDSLFVDGDGLLAGTRGIATTDIRLAEVGRPNRGLSFVIGAVVSGTLMAVTMGDRVSEDGVRPGSDAKWIAGTALIGGLLSMAIDPVQRWIRVTP